MQVKGTSLKVHPTFIILVILCIILGMAARAFIVFGLVLLHETVHTLTARAYGYKVTNIELYPYGGTAVLEGNFEGRRVEESIIAFAGPALNICLFIVLQVLRWEGIAEGDWIYELAKINFWLAAFNLLPVLPLDGGRIARAFLTRPLGFIRSTKILAQAGKWLGGLFIVFGFFMQAWGFVHYEPGMFIILGLFFWVGSSRESFNARIVFLRHLCAKKELLLSKGLMPSSSLIVKRDTPLSRIIDELTIDSYSLINVIGRNDDVEKTFSETQVVEGMMNKGLKCKIGDIE